jgi:hypothetical protein
VQNAGAVKGSKQLTLDGAVLSGDAIPLSADGKEHEVVLTLGA